MTAGLLMFGLFHREAIKTHIYVDILSCKSDSKHVTWKKRENYLTSPWSFYVLSDIHRRICVSSNTIMYFLLVTDTWLATTMTMSRQPSTIYNYILHYMSNSIFMKSTRNSCTHMDFLYVVRTLVIKVFIIIIFFLLFFLKKKYVFQNTIK